MLLNSLPLDFLRHSQLRALLQQLFLEHLAGMRVSVTALDGAAALLDSEIQAAPIDTGHTHDSSGKAAGERPYRPRSFPSAIVAVETAGVAEKISRRLRKHGNFAKVERIAGRLGA